MSTNPHSVSDQDESALESSDGNADAEQKDAVSEMQAEAVTTQASQDMAEAQPEAPVAESPAAQPESEASPVTEPPVDQSQPEPEASPVADSADGDVHPMEALLDAEDYTLNPLHRGQVVEGTIVRIGTEEVLVDVGAKSEGLVPSGELQKIDKKTRDSLEIGQVIKVYVFNPEDRNGNPLLSIARASEEEDWERAKEHMDSGKVYEGKIAGFNKGGLLVNFGQLRGFLPSSQVSNDRPSNAGGSPEERWGDMLHDSILVKVLEVEREGNRLILSERAAAKENRAARKAELLEELEKGQIRKGRIISLADFGAFVDLGGADGLVHLSELSWHHINHPKDIVSVGQEVEVEVIDVDPDRQRIGLSMKRRADDPWTVFANSHAKDQLVQAKVTKLTKFGAFAELVDTPGVEGLIHVSELANRRVNHPKEVVDEGELLTLRIVRIDAPGRRLGLSLKQADSEEFLDSDWQSTLDEANSDVAEEAEAPAQEAAVEAVAEEAEAPAGEPAAEPEVQAETESVETDGETEETTGE